MAKYPYLVSQNQGIVMRHFLILSLAFLLGYGGVSVASAQSNTPSDASNVAKDEADIAKARMDIERDRAQKAQDKANGNWLGQAFDSLALGYDHVFHTEKMGEKSADTIISNHKNN